jgi:hypothetical protein
MFTPALAVRFPSIRAGLGGQSPVEGCIVQAGQAGDRDQRGIDLSLAGRRRVNLREAYPIVRGHGDAAVEEIPRVHQPPFVGPEGGIDVQELVAGGEIVPGIVDVETPVHVFGLHEEVVLLHILEGPVVVVGIRPCEQHLQRRQLAGPPVEVCVVGLLVEGDAGQT